MLFMFSSCVVVFMSAEILIGLTTPCTFPFTFQFGCYNLLINIKADKAPVKQVAVHYRRHAGQ